MSSYLHPSKTRLSPTRTYPTHLDSDSPPTHLALTSPPPIKHWSQTCHETILSSNDHHHPIRLNLSGGADNGQFVYLNEAISLLKSNQTLFAIIKGGKIEFDEILLEVDQHKIAGCTLADVHKLIETFSSNGKQIKLKSVKSGTGYLHNARREIGDHSIKFSCTRTVLIILKNFSISLILLLLTSNREG